MDDKIAIIINSILYVLKKFENDTTNFHKVFKILYFAEREHLAKYGNTITQDTYASMPDGPVPSIAYNIFKIAKGLDLSIEGLDDAATLISVHGKFQVRAIGDVDLDWLSISEMTCLDKSYEENKDLSFGELSDKSHDIAWEESNHWMDNLKIAQAGGASEPMIEYISQKQENNRLIF